MAPTALGTLISEARKERGWSLAALVSEAQKRGFKVTAQAVNQLENGDTSNPSIRLVRALCETLEIPFEQVVQVA